MSYTIERLEGLPALLLSFGDDVSFIVSMGTASEEFHVILEAAETPLYCIADFRNVQMSFNDIMCN